MICSKCNATIADDLAFCPECGQPVEALAPAEEPVAAPVQAECAECEEAVAPEQEAPVAEEKKVPKIPKKFIAIGAIAAAAVLVIVLAISLIFGGSVNNYALFIADGEIQYADMPGGKPFELTSDLYEDASNRQLTSIASNYYLVQVSKDGSKIFFPDKGDEGGFSLYYRNTNGKGEAVKLVSDLSGYYYINEKGTLVTYTKDGKLYQHDLKESTKLASDIYTYYVTDDGKTILYLADAKTDEETEETTYTLYRMKKGKDAEKLVSDISGVRYCSEDMNTVAYIKNDALYTKTGTKEAKKIDSDVMNIYSVGDGKFYYTKQEDSEVTYWSLINNDLDSAAEEEFSWMKEQKTSNPVKSLYYFDGKKTAAVTETMVGYYLDYATEKPVFIYTALGKDETPSVKLSVYKETAENNYYVDFDQLINEAMADSKVTYIAMDASATELKLENIDDCTVSNEGDVVYVSSDLNTEDKTVTLTKITLSGSKIKKTEKIAEDVAEDSCRLVNDNEIYFFKEVDENEGELYLNGTKVADDVYTSYVKYNAEEDYLFYMTDYDAEKRMGTLKFFNGKKSATVKDDVYEYQFTPGGETLFLYDYDLGNYVGELWILNGTKTSKIADDVVAMMPIYDRWAD